MQGWVAMNGKEVRHQQVEVYPPPVLLTRNVAIF